MSSYADPLALAHNEEHLTKFEMLLEASLDLDRVPEEYLVSAAYDPRLQVRKGGRATRVAQGIWQKWFTCMGGMCAGSKWGVIYGMSMLWAGKELGDFITSCPAWS